MTDIFISYARSSEEQAQRVGETLEALGYEVWRDEKLAAHETYAEMIERRLAESRAVLVLWSRDAVKSQWVRSEADRARAQGKLVQLNIDGSSLPMPFDQIQCADLVHWRGDPEAPGWRRALSSLSQLLGREPPAAASLAWRSGDGDKPSIAVLPFANLSNDPDQDYFVDGLTEEIVTSLTRIRTLFVIASGSSLSLKGQGLSPNQAAEKLGVRYIVEGSIRRAGERIRIAASLIDAQAGSQIWAERFDDRLDDVFALQDRIAQAVAGVIEFSVQNAEAVRSIHRPTSDLRSYELYLRALTHFRTYRREDMFQALELLERAIERDPDYALALSLAASAHAIILQFRWSDDPALHQAGVAEMTARSLKAGSTDPQVLGTAALGYYTTGELAAASRLADRAVELNPGSSFALLAQGQVRSALGDFEIAEQSLSKSMKLDPLSPNRNLQLQALAVARFGQERYPEAADLAREMVQLTPHAVALGLLAASTARLGECAEAKAAVRRMASASPSSDQEVAAIIYHQAQHRTAFLEALAAARDA
ncbi:MAG: TIR domain-containing protein [Caulobacteraceae bacterium]